MWILLNLPSCLLVLGAFTVLDGSASLSAQPSYRSDDGENPSGSFQRDVCFLLVEVANAQNAEIWEADG